MFSEASAFNADSYANTLGPGGMHLYYASQIDAPSTTVNSWNYVTQTSDIFPTIPWLAQGGTVKTIFIGESAGSANDFGFIKAGADLSMSSNYTSIVNDVVNTGDASGNIQSGWEAMVNYGAGEQLDFWLNNPGTFVPGGTYFSFLQNGAGSAFANGDPYAHTKFSWTSVMTEYVDLNGATVHGNVDTLLIAYEDLRGPELPPGGGLPTIPPGDADYTDFIVAFQFLPDQLPPVPEPSTYGLMGAAALVALVGYRRWKSPAKTAA